MELQPKTEPGFCSNHEMKLENMSIHDLVSVLRTAYQTEQFDSVEEILVSRDKKLKTEIQHLQEKFDMERQARLQAEEDLKKSEELCERGKMAQNNYEKSLMEIKNNCLGESESIVELKMNNNELELEVSENEKNASEVKNGELEKSLKICEALADAGISAFQEKEIVDAAPLQIIEPPMKRSKDDQGASSAYNKMGDQSEPTSLFALPPPDGQNAAVMIPPSTRVRQKQSSVWNHFTLDPNSEKTGICNYCGRKINYHGTTSMAKHFKRCKNNPNNESNKR